MVKTGSIQWNFVFVSTAGILLTAFAVLAAPYYNIGGAPVLLTIAAAILLLGRGKPRMVDLAVLAMIGALALTTISSIEIHRSWVWLSGIGGGLISLLASRDVVRRWLPVEILLAGLLVGGLVFQITLTGRLLSWIREWHTLFPEAGIPLLSFRFDNGNDKAGFLIPLILILLGLFFTTRLKWARWLLAAGVMWSLVLFYFCSSRGGMVGLGAAGLTFVIAERRVIGQWLAPAWKVLARRRWLVAVLGLAVLGGAAAGGWVLFQAIESHPTHAAFGIGSRAGFWLPAWDAFLRSPVWGNGIFTEAGFYLDTISVPPDGFYYHAHNMYLDILQGMGLIGAAAAGGLIVALWRGLRRARVTALRQAQDNALKQNQSARVLTMAPLPALAGFLAHSLFDSLYWLPMVSIPLVVMFGAALAFDEQKLKIKLPAAQITAVLVLVLAWGLYFVQQPYLSAFNNAGVMGWQQTAEGFDQAVKRLPMSPLLQREAGYAWAELAAQGDTAALEKAILRFEAAAENDPNFALNWLNLGSLQREAGDLTGSRASLETASEKAWKWGLAWLSLGEVCEQQGDEGCARQAYLKALEREPDWTSDPYWQESPLRASTSAAAKAAQSGSESPGPLVMEKAIQQPYMLPVLKTAEEKIRTGELDDAERLLKVAPMLFVGRETELIELHWLEAELAAAKGDTDLAAELGLLARVEFETNRLNDAIAAGVYVYGPGIYQLPTLGIDLVPQVTWMEYPGDWQDRMAQLSSWQE